MYCVQLLLTLPPKRGLLPGWVQTSQELKCRLFGFITAAFTTNEYPLKSDNKLKQNSTFPTKKSGEALYSCWMYES
jgi:hypothetical protein